MPVPPLMLSPRVWIISSRMEGWVGEQLWLTTLPLCQITTWTQRLFWSGLYQAHIVTCGLWIMVAGKELEHFQRKKSLLTCCRAQSSLLWQKVLSLLSNHKNGGKIQGIFWLLSCGNWT